MAGKMNKTWWLANKAKTLGAVDKAVAAKVDKVTSALDACDAAFRRKKPAEWFMPNAEKIIGDIALAAKALKPSANTVLHGATIETLDYYVRSADGLVKNIKEATGKYWADQFLKSILSQADQLEIKSLDAIFWATKLENYEFLAAMKASSNHGSAAMYTKFVLGQGSEIINVNPSILAKLKVSHTTHNYNPDQGWLLAKTEILGMLGQTSSFAAPMKVIQQKHFIKQGLEL